MIFGLPVVELCLKTSLPKNLKKIIFNVFFNVILVKFTRQGGGLSNGKKPKWNSTDIIFELPLVDLCGKTSISKILEKLNFHVSMMWSSLTTENTMYFIK